MVGSTPPHLSTPAERSKAIEMDKLFIDLGMTAEEVKKRVRIGDQIVMKEKAVELAGGAISGKTMDDRACVATMLECAKNLNMMNAPATTLMVSTSKEEVGSWGAAATAYNLAPDVAIVVDVGHAEGPGTGKWEAVPLDKPSIATGPNLHPMLTRKLCDIARKHRVEYSLEVAPGGTTGTDASATNVSRGGIPTVLISLPLKYMHTSVEIVSMETIREIGRLMALFINEISREWEDLKWY